MKLKRGFIKSTFYLLLAISHFISVHAVEEGSYDKIEQFIMSDNRLVPNIQLAQSYIDVSDIIPTSTDITPPSIDITTLSVEPKEAQPGDTVKISAKIEDDLSGVSVVRVDYKIPITNKEKSIYLYDQGNNLYEGKVVEVDEFTENGTWQIKSILLQDNKLNSVVIYNQNLGYVKENKEDLSSGDFTVIGTTPDITPPSIDITTLSVEPKEAQLGDQVKISAKIEDDLSGVSVVGVDYITPITNKEKSIYLYDQGNNLYEGVFEVDEFTQNGTWQLYRIFTRDNKLNFIDIYSQNSGYDAENKEDLSSGDFTVSIPRDEVIDIPDNELKKQLNINLGKLETDEITLEELQSFTKLDLSSKKISNIEGLQYATNLSTLSLSYNKISDISPLGEGDFSNLLSLGLAFNRISDISGLARGNFDKLTTLNLSNNQISDISPLAEGNFDKLTTLNLSNNQISDISVLSETNFPWLNHVSLTQQEILLEPVKVSEGQSVKISNPIIDNKGQYIAPYAINKGGRYDDEQNQIIWDDINQSQNLNVFFTKQFFLKFQSNAFNATIILPVTIVDTTAPVITLSGDEILTVEAGSIYEELGAKAIDSVDGELAVTIDGEVNTKVLGTYIVTYTATDSSGNVSKIERKVTVLDTTAPVITLNGDVWAIFLLP